ncbi:hypothetical protein HPB51_018656 [Rhipicephalus microplus]|uniref:Uncharacterized protein n=1 Tax=Rhipicephalus microplus TaxID=6941 RepID=A0A9J6F4X4_RHIMP|nr:uncharacterized protein LOC119159978 [Rhipicephalus microplus]KAH8041862.1 hypothetical protein HPB51_018656 [Rhipicephalus microplus]
MYKRGMSIELHSNHCDVYLCRAPLRNAVAGWPATLFASASRSAYGDSWEKHWLVIFDYGQDEVLLCDADQDHAGELTGRKSWKKRAVFKYAYAYKKYLGKYQVPEWCIDLAMRQMCDSGPYRLLKNNCQKWVHELLHRLGVKVPRDDPDLQTVSEVMPKTIGNAFIVAAAVAVAKCLLR